MVSCSGRHFVRGGTDSLSADALFRLASVRLAWHRWAAMQSSSSAPSRVLANHSLKLTRYGMPLKSNVRRLKCHLRSVTSHRFWKAKSRLRHMSAGYNERLQRTQSETRSASKIGNQVRATEMTSIKRFYDQRAKTRTQAKTLIGVCSASTTMRSREQGDMDTKLDSPCFLP